MVAVLLPWPRKAERKARVEAARQRAELARREATEAQKLPREMHEILQENHLVQKITDGLLEARRRQQGEK